MNTNLHSRNSNRSVFFNVGLFLASFTMASSYAVGVKEVSTKAFISPFFAFGASALFAFIASRRVKDGFDIVRDGSALPVFFTAYLLSGNTRPWLYAMLILSVMTLAILYFTRNKSDYCNKDDIINIH